jgi:hypothetical protein
MANKSKTYCIPLLNEYIPIRNMDLLDNTFIYFDKSEYPNTIGLLYKLSDSEEFNNMMSDYETSDLLITYHLEPTKVLFIFAFPEEFEKDYSLFKDGKYSQLSNKAKSIIIEFTRNTYQYEPILTDLVDILYKRDNRRYKLEKDLQISISGDSELSSKINAMDETYKL